LLDDLESAVMHGYQQPGLQESNRSQGVVGPHGVVVAYREQSHINDLLFSQELHVMEEPGVGGRIDPFGVYVEEESARVAGVAAIGEAGAMMCDGHLHSTEGELTATSNVQAVSFNSTLLAIGRYLVMGDDDGPVRSVIGIASPRWSP